MVGKKRAAPKLGGAKKVRCQRSPDSVTGHADPKGRKPKPASPATEQVPSDLVTQHTRLDALHRAVLDTTERLECILSHLPPKQIFGVQRVARLWEDVITRSPRI